MAAVPVWQSRTVTVQESQSSIVVAKPASVASGDLLLAFITTVDGTVAIVPAGWTLIRSTAGVHDAIPSNLTLYSYYRVATASEPANWTWQLNNTPYHSSGVINRITGIHPSAPIHGNTGAANTSGTDATGPSITTTAINCLLVFACAVADATTVTQPSGMTERWDQVDASFWADIEGATVGFVGPGATGNKVASHSNLNNVAQLIAVAPPPPVVHSAAATGTGAGAITANASVSRPASTTGSGAGSLSAVGAKLVSVAASLSALGSISAAASVWDPYGSPEVLVWLETSPGVWLAVSDDLIRGQTHRGRQNELDRYNTGTATLVFQNNDRKYDPVYADSPLAGYLDVRHRMRIEAFQNGVTYPIFFGYIDAISQTRALSNNHATATIKLSDFFKVMNKAVINGTAFPVELSGARIIRVLDLLGVPAGMRDIDAGGTELQAGEYSSTLLAHAQTVAQTEFGDFFVRADGVVRFKSRDAALDEPIQGTFGEAPDEIHYNSLTPQFNDQLIRNPVSVDRNGGIRQTVEDTDLTELPPVGYGVNHYSLSGTYHNSDADALGAAEYLLGRYKHPTRRVVGLGFGPVPYAEAPITYPHVLGRELSERVMIVERPMGIGSEIRQSSVIEGISHEFSPKQWKTTWDVSPGFASGDFWVLGVSALGDDTILYF